MIDKYKNRPILFIGGAPKSGTSSVFNILSRHPEMIPSRIKETNYFVDMDHPRADPFSNVHRSGIEGFYSFFPNEHIRFPEKILLEGSTQLIYQKDIFKFIDQLHNLKVLFILREPAVRILSAFEYAKYNRSALLKVLSFNQYVDLLLSDNAEELVHYFKSPTDHFLGKELEISSYQDHLARWFEALGKKRVNVIQFEAFKKDPSLVISRICHWLRVESFELSNNEFRNSTISPRSLQLHQFVVRMSSLFPDLKIKQTLKKYYVRLQPKPKRNPDEIEHGITLLKEYFKPKNKLLKDLKGFDLDLWQ